MRNNLPSFRSPLGNVRALGAAKSGTHHWWLQRLTAVALIPLTVYPLIVLLLHAVDGGYESTVNWLYHSRFAVAGIILFLGVGFHHAASGLQVVIEDYVHCEKAKIVSIIAVTFASIALFVLGSLAALKVMLGG